MSVDGARAELRNLDLPILASPRIGQAVVEQFGDRADDHRWQLGRRRVPGSGLFRCNDSILIRGSSIILRYCGGSPKEQDAKSSNKPPAYLHSKAFHSTESGDPGITIQGSSENITSPEEAAGRTALHQAAWSGNFVALGLMLEGNPPRFDPNAPDRERRTALLLAALPPAAKEARGIFAVGARILQQWDSQARMGSLQRQGRRLPALLERGADGGIQDRDGRNAACTRRRGRTTPKLWTG